jgi:hypothetical protein
VPIELGVWRLDAAGPRRLAPTALANEAQLEEIIEREPSILGLGPLLIVGRQVATAYGKFIDLLALDAEGKVAVVELKRDRTPRDVVVQALDYGSWIVDLGYDEIVEIHALTRTTAISRTLSRRRSGNRCRGAQHESSARRGRLGTGLQHRAHRRLPRATSVPPPPPLNDRRGRRGQVWRDQT